MQKNISISLVLDLLHHHIFKNYNSWKICRQMGRQVKQLDDDLPNSIYTSGSGPFQTTLRFLFWFVLWAFESRFQKVINIENLSCYFLKENGIYYYHLF